MLFRSVSQSRYWVSNDGGKSFSDPIPQQLGQAGDYFKRVIWRRLGMSRNRVNKFTVREPIKCNLIGSEMIADIGDANNVK